MRSPARWAMAAVALASVSALSGCVLFAGPPNEEVGLAIKEHIDENRVGGKSTIDLASVFPDSWTRSVIVCRGATQDELDSVLGFEWAPDPALNDVGFDSLMVLVSDDEVVRTFSTGQDDAWVNRKAFTFCSYGSGPDAAPYPLLAEAPREHSTLTFTRWVEEPTPDLDNLWYVAGSDLSVFSDQ